MGLNVMACVQPALRDSPDPCTSGMVRDCRRKKAQAIHELTPIPPFEGSSMNRHCHPSNLVIAMLLATGLSACNSPGTAPMTSEVPEKTIEFKQNPNPQRAYRIVMEIENAPGPFSSVEGSAQYDVMNEEECGVFSAMAGGYNRETTSPPVRWERLSETTYAATIHADLMLDEDYFGRGICRWELTEVRGRLRATGAEGETRFVPSIAANEIESAQSVKWFFWKGGYPVDLPLPSNGKGFTDFGYLSSEKFKPELRGELFSITLTSTEEKP